MPEGAKAALGQILCGCAEPVFRVLTTQFEDKAKSTACLTPVASADTWAALDWTGRENTIDTMAKRTSRGREDWRRRVRHRQS
jgi:hypothetical protein